MLKFYLGGREQGDEWTVHNRYWAGRRHCGCAVEGEYMISY